MSYEFLPAATSTIWKADNQALAKTIVARAEQRSPRHATFLSPSTNDAGLLPVAIKILENHGATVCVDKKDASLPPYTNRDTGRTPRKDISV